MKKKTFKNWFVTKKKILSMVIVILGAVGIFSACGNKDEKGLEKITFVLDWTPNTNHTGIYVAQKLGYFEENGLEVEIVQPPEDGAEMMVASGHAQFGISFQDSMAAALAGEDTMPITAVAAILQHNTSGIISLKEKGIDTPRKMEGNSYAVWNGPLELATVQHIIESDGGKFSKLELIPSVVNDEITALKTNTADLLWIYYAWAGVKMELEGIQTNYIPFAEIDPVFDYYTPVIISGDRFLSENPDTAKAFLDAAKKGYEYAIENPSSAADILVDAAPELDEKLVKASQEYVAKEYKADENRWGYIDKDRWNNFYNWINDNELLEGKIEQDVGFSNEFLPE